MGIHAETEFIVEAQAPDAVQFVLFVNRRVYQVHRHAAEGTLPCSQREEVGSHLHRTVVKCRTGDLFVGRFAHASLHQLVHLGGEDVGERKHRRQCPDGYRNHAHLEPLGKAGQVEHITRKDQSEARDGLQLVGQNNGHRQKGDQVPQLAFPRAVELRQAEDHRLVAERTEVAEPDQVG